MVLKTPPVMSVFSGLSKVNNHLFISGARAVTEENVRNHGITAIINITLTSPPLPLPDLEYIRILVDDSTLVDLTPHFDPVADKINEVKEKGGKTLVHCLGGASRSATLCLVYLMKYQNMKLQDAYRYLKKCRPVVRPNNGFFSQLIEYEKKLFGESTVKMVEVPSVGPDLVVPDIFLEEYKGFVWLKSVKASLSKKE
ncbi:dual specificity protein phosphatase 18-like isoform X2 [Limulus polyphemus]|uniref:Dual specificity protein phosphatase 18-like isoform X2 n=1 Tax=Limulus polyphemus TaxID=6850 RepID=A0ABM1TM54_LIMPO|nr:dual specificity protein phosphatase 18-like isoform X2 [Limulus polyphemus]